MICTTCGDDKKPEEFNWKIKAKRRRARKCKVCHKAYRDQHYQDNKTKRLRQAKARSQSWEEKNRRFIVQYLQSNPCIDCGESDILVLEFDHRDPRAKRNIHRGRKGRGCVSDFLKHSRARLIKEIEKCDVRCANCHKRRTAVQMNSYRLQFVADPEGVEPSIAGLEAAVLPLH